MKKITILFFCLLISTAGFSQALDGVWQMIPEAGAYFVGDQGQGSANFFANSAADVTQRDCYFDDTYVFNEDGSFENVDGGITWREGWQATPDGCGASVAPHDGSNPATWVYDVVAGTLTLNGTGAYIGLPKAVNGSEINDPNNAPASVTYLVSELTATSLALDINVGGTIWWAFRLQKVTNQDVSLSDLQLDGVTIDGFEPSTATYQVRVAEGAPVPVVSATATDPLATVGNITQATSVPGSATFDVISEDASLTQTYTVNFINDFDLTELVDNGGFETGDFTGWTTFDSQSEYSVVSTNPASGSFAARLNNTTPQTPLTLKSANKGIGIVNAGDEITIKFDARGSAGAGGVLFAEFFSEIDPEGVSGSVLLGGAPISLNGNPETWTTYTYTLNAASNVSGGITLQFNAATGGDPGSFTDFFIDNVSMVNNDEVLSTNQFDIADFNVYPNPTKTNWTVKTNNGQNITGIEVYDILGKQVLRAIPNASEFAINASGLNDGIYLAKIISDNGSTTIKLVKN